MVFELDLKRGRDISQAMVTGGRAVQADEHHVNTNRAREWQMGICCYYIRLKACLLWPSLNWSPLAQSGISFLPSLVLPRRKLSLVQAKQAFIQQPKNGEMETYLTIQFRWRHQIYREVDVKQRKLERVIEIFMSYLRAELWFGHRTHEILFFIELMQYSFSVLL